MDARDYVDDLEQLARGCHRHRLLAVQRTMQPDGRHRSHGQPRLQRCLQPPVDECRLETPLPELHGHRPVAVRAWQRGQPERRAFLADRGTFALASRLCGGRC